MQLAAGSVDEREQHCEMPGCGHVRSERAGVLAALDQRLEEREDGAVVAAKLRLRSPGVDPHERVEAAKLAPGRLKHPVDLDPQATAATSGRE